MLLLGILTLAAVLRFAYPGVNSFAGDEAHISLDALRMARGGEFVMAGQPSSVAIPFFPASVWLFALPYAVSPDPLVATWFVSAVSVATVAGAWWLGRQWNPTAGLVAALFMAASPYAVFYGRSIWQPNMLAPLGLLWAGATYLAATRDDRAGKLGTAVAVLVGLLTFQVHFAGIALAAATGYCFLRFRWWRRLLPVMAGAGLAALAVLPYVWYVTVAAPEVLERYGAVLGGGGDGGASFDLQGAENLARLALAWDWSFLGMGDADIHSRTLPTVVLAGVLVGLGVAAVVVTVVRGVRSRERMRPSSTRREAIEKSARGRSWQTSFAQRSYNRNTEHFDSKSSRMEAERGASSILSEIVVVWLAASPLVFLGHSTPVLIHYQLIALPALALLAGASTLVFERQSIKLALSVGMVGLAAVWTAQIQQTLAYTAEHRPPNSALSSILRESRDAAYEPDAPILFFAHGDDPAIDGEVAVFETLLWERPHRTLNGDVLLVLPPYPATLLATLAPFQAWEELEAAGLANEAQEYPRRIGAEPFVAARYDGVSAPEGFTEIEPVSFADGTTLVGWKARRVGTRLRISTLWEVESEGTAGTFQQFHHLRRDEGEPMISDVPLSRGTWMVGDQVIVMADFFDVPAGTENLTVDAGHYRLEDMARVPLRDSAETSVRLGSFSAP